jgi:hypothetical protein
VPDPLKQPGKGHHGSGRTVEGGDGPSTAASLSGPDPTGSRRPRVMSAVLLEGSCASHASSRQHIRRKKYLWPAPSLDRTVGGQRHGSAAIQAGPRPQKQGCNEDRDTTERMIMQQQSVLRWGHISVAQLRKCDPPSALSRRGPYAPSPYSSQQASAIKCSSRSPPIRKQLFHRAHTCNITAKRANTKDLPGRPQAGPSGPQTPLNTVLK